MSRVGLLVAVLALLVATLPAFTVTAQLPSLLDLLPSATEIGPAFVEIDSRARTLGEQATGFADTDDAARLLAGWEWQENAFRVFQSSELTPSGASLATVDISLTRFASTEDAAEALPYFLRDRIAVLGEQELPAARPIIGDEARVIAGDVPGGYDSTLYVRAGTLLLRISATAATGSPATAPERIAQGIIDRANGRPAVGSVAQTAVASLPETLPLTHATCFRVAGEGALDRAGVVSRLAASADVSARLDALGWESGDFRQFACDPPDGRAGWVDLSVHHFADPGAASAAVDLFAASRGRSMKLQSAKAATIGDRSAALSGPAVNGTEYTLYVSSGSLLFAVTGVAPDGDPQPDVAAIAASLLAPATPRQVPEQPTPTPYALGETSPAPVIAPTPTAMPTVLPTVLPAPTATPKPTATFVPTPLPTATTIPEPPALIPVDVPAAAPLPTATAGPLPTPTPRVIRPPTPAAD